MVMGFIAPAAPPVDMEEWRKLPHLQRIKPLAQDWALNGVGAPTVVYLLYMVKLLIFALGGALIISAYGGRGSAGSAAFPTGGPNRSSFRRLWYGRCCGRSSAWAPDRCR